MTKVRCRELTCERCRFFDEKILACIIDECCQQEDRYEDGFYDYPKYEKYVKRQQRRKTRVKRNR